MDMEVKNADEKVSTFDGEANTYKNRLEQSKNEYCVKPPN